MVSQNKTLFPSLLLAFVCWIANASPILRNERGASLEDDTPLLGGSGHTGGQVSTLYPRYHPEHDAHDHSHLKLHNVKDLFFAQDTPTKYAPPDARYLTAQTSFKYKAVVLDHSAHLRISQSDDGFIASFGNRHTYKVAKDEWTLGDLPFVLVTTTGSTDRHFGYYLTFAVECDDGSSTCHLDAEVAEFDDVVDGFNLGFGNFGHLAKRRADASPVKRDPPTPSSTYDAMLDAKLGYYSWAQPDFATSLKQFAEGLTDTNFNDYNDQNQDSGSLFGPDGKASVSPMLTPSPDDFAVTFGKRDADVSKFSKRSFFSAASNLFGSVEHAAASAVYSAATAVENTVVSAVTSAGDAVFATVDTIASYVDGSPHVLKNEKSVAYPPANYPNYVSQTEFTDANGNPYNAIQLYNLTKGNAMITAYCLGCTVQADVTLTGTFAYKLGSGLQQGSIALDANFFAQLLLGVEIQYAVSKMSSQRLFELPLAGITVPKFLDVGPMLTVDFTTSFSFNAIADVLVGASLTIPTVHAVLDVVNPQNNQRPIFSPQIVPMFAADAAVTASLTLGLPIGVAVGVSIAEGKATADVSLVSELLFSATAMASASNSGTCNGGISTSYQLEYTLYSQADANLIFSSYGPVQKTLIDKQKGSASTQCITLQSSKKRQAKKWYRDMKQASRTLPSVPSSSPQPFPDLDTGFFGGLYSVPKPVKAFLTTLSANHSSSFSTKDSDTSQTTFNYSLISDSSISWTMVATQEGNLGFQSSSLNDTGNAFFATYSHVVIADSTGRSLIYYPMEMAAYNVSRLRVVPPAQVPKTSRIVGLVPYKLPGAALTGSLPRSAMVPVDTTGRHFFVAICRYTDGVTPSRLFLINDPKQGILTLQNATVSGALTGKSIAKCQLIALVNGDAI